MFKTARIKLYRRFLMLAVLLTCLYALPVSNKADARPPGCCHACDGAYGNCLIYCATYVKEDDYESCVASGCEVNYDACAKMCASDIEFPDICTHP
jgi:hypothetical protein